MSRKFTAEDMRKVAKSLLSSEVNLDFDKRNIAYMLKHAADIRERLDEVNKVVGDELKKQEHCRKCEWRGKSIRSEPACPCDEDVHGVVFDIGVTDMIVKALRGDLEREEKREKKYEYAVRMDSGEVYGQFHNITEARDEAKFVNSDGLIICHAVRREVGEWEEVSSEG